MEVLGDQKPRRLGSGWQNVRVDWEPQGLLLLSHLGVISEDRVWAIVERVG